MDLFLVPISSVLANTDFPLKEWRAAGLNISCGVKAQLATVEARLVVKVIGQLANNDTKVLNTQLRNWLQL